ncbi:MAG: metal ABC transporter substrate-binding protein [Phycisphaera sp.]|nr:MAG: metal ABC transporter substrate-binding protein [Phycisphaera sp.]
MHVARALTVSISILMFSLAGCNESSPNAPAASLDDAVLTTFYPTQYFAERIAGGLVPVRSPLPEGEDPIFWQPDADAISEYQNARLVITNGAEFEKWVAGAALPRARTVESLDTEALDATGGSITMESTTHSHGPGGEHTHAGLDGHTWVSPNIAILQAKNIAEAMKAAWPDHADAFDANLASLIEDLEMLRTSLMDLAPLVDEHQLLASHPAYNYLIRDMGWSITNLDLDPDSEDMDAIVAGVRDVIEGDKPVILLWEGQPTDAIVTALRDELGVTSTLFSPAEGTPDGGDYMDVMLANIDRLREAVGG